MSGISNVSSNQHSLSNSSTTYQQSLQQFSQALQSGNLSAAQSDFATLQQAFSQPASTISSSSTSNPSSASNPVAQAFNRLASDLQSGNLSAAQKDYTGAQQGLRSQSGPSKGHFHHHNSLQSGSVDSSDQDSLLQELSQIGQSIASGSLAAAQQAYSAAQLQPALSFNGAPPSQSGSPGTLLSNLELQAESSLSASPFSLVA
jgi:hypothetical protein